MEHFLPSFLPPFTAFSTLPLPSIGSFNFWSLVSRSAHWFSKFSILLTIEMRFAPTFSCKLRRRCCGLFCLLRVQGTQWGRRQFAAAALLAQQWQIPCLLFQSIWICLMNENNIFNFSKNRSTFPVCSWPWQFAHTETGFGESEGITVLWGRHLSQKPNPHLEQPC